MSEIHNPEYHKARNRVDLSDSSFGRGFRVAHGSLGLLLRRVNLPLTFFKRTAVQIQFQLLSAPRKHTHSYHARAHSGHHCRPAAAVDLVGSGTPFLFFLVPPNIFIQFIERPIMVSFYLCEQSRSSNLP